MMQSSGDASPPGSPDPGGTGAGDTDPSPNTANPNTANPNAANSGNRNSGVSRRMFGRVAYGVLAVAAIGTATGYSIRSASAKGDLSSNLTLIAPAGAGGGWDGFARETQQAMRATRTANNAQVVNIPGAGGTIGLGKFSTMHGRADTILATGTAMVGGIALNDSPVGFDDTTLLARVAEDYDVLIAAADSPYDTLEDVMTAWQEDPEGFVWTGGSAGSVDHLTIAQLAQLGGIPGSAITYIPKSGGGESIQTLLSGTTDFASTGFNEVSDQIEAGRVKAIGLAAPRTPSRLRGHPDDERAGLRGHPDELARLARRSRHHRRRDRRARRHARDDPQQPRMEGRPGPQPVDGRVADRSGVRRLHRRRHQAHRSAA